MVWKASLEKGKPATLSGWDGNTLAVTKPNTLSNSGEIIPALDISSKLSYTQELQNQQLLSTSPQNTLITLKLVLTRKTFLAHAKM